MAQLVIMPTEKAWHDPTYLKTKGWVQGAGDRDAETGPCWFPSQDLDSMGDDVSED